jgi:hypothetical protein
MNRAPRVLAVGLAALLASLATGYFVGKQVPSLEAPVSIEAASALSDGGSMHVVLRDAKSRRYAIGVEGSLRVPSSDFGVYVQPWFSFFPLPIYIPKKSQEEKALLSAIAAWSGQLAGAQPEAGLLTQVAGVLRARRGDLGDDRP